MRCRVGIFITAVALSWAAPGCKSAPKNDHFVKSVITANLKVRRPAGPGADPYNGPGGVDYHAQPLPNERLDCESVEWLFREIDLKALRVCMRGMKSPLFRVKYLLKRESVPYMELVEAEQNPECLKTLLPKIPLPREIIFQTPQEGKYSCYSSRLDIELDEVLGSKLPRKRIELNLDFPLVELPASSREMVHLLGGWVLTVFWDLEGKGVKSKVVIDQLCRKCIGEKMMYEDGVPEPLTWPSGGDSKAAPAGALPGQK